MRERPTVDQPTDPTTAGAWPLVPGVPTVEPVAAAEPVEPREPLPPKADQQPPEAVSPTGSPTGAPADARSQSGAYLTTAHGTRLPDSDHSLRAGPRGPVLLRDQHLREKVSHFDHERIPERVVHARGAAAHGVFRSYGSAAGITRAGVLQADVETPVFVRFSTVVGSRGSADTVRDTRGFAVKFYTDEGNWDLVGNNMPVFFVQDAIKFPDVVHAAKPHPDREIPQAQSAHDTFWDFVSLHTEAQHHAMWAMSDRGIPRSYRTMEGFGVNTFRLVAADGSTTLVKWHWKPVAGVHSLVWEEAQLLAGTDPDFHRRDLADAIESGAFPQWELGIQVMPDTEDQTFEGIDLWDVSKLVPEEMCPVQPVGMMTLTANPVNYFAQTEQVAFSVGNLVPGIDVTDDPLMAGRLFSYVDTQITRLGGPNWNQLPINRAHAPVNDMLRDGFHQQAVHGGVAPYRPNSMDGGCPFVAGADMGGYVDVAATVPAGRRVREAPLSFADHTTQPRIFFRSLTPLEQAHTVDAYVFELGKCWDETVRVRQLGVLARIDADLCARVADGLGLPVPTATEPLAEVTTSAALSQVGGTWPVAGRTVGVLATETSDLAGVRALCAQISAAGMTALVVGPKGGKLGQGTPDELPVQRTLHTTRSVEYDAVLSAGPLAPDPRAVQLVAEAFLHGKAVGGFDGAEESLVGAGLTAGSPGVVLADGAGTALTELVALLGEHRVWDRLAAAGQSA